jgi:type IV pilus assembly protein PilW
MNMAKHSPAAATGFGIDSNGFSLIELIIGIAVSAIILSAIWTSYLNLQNNSNQQVQVAMLQQNLRGVLAIMERELRMAGQDFMQNAAFGVTDVRKFSVVPPGTDAVPDNTANGRPILRMTLDFNDNGQLDAGETITYSLYDKDGDGGLFDLGRSTSNPGGGVVSGMALVADGIEALDFAYAFDNDGDGAVDRTPLPDNNIIWAVDSNNDGLLDSDLLGVALGYTVQPQNIKAIQVWVLARAKRPDRKYVNSHQYSVGTQVIGPTNDAYRRWMLTEVLHCRNL